MADRVRDRRVYGHGIYDLFGFCYTACSAHNRKRFIDALLITSAKWGNLAVRYLVDRLRVRTTAQLLAIGSAALSGCGQLSPAASTDVLSQLRAGSDKVCIAKEVQRSLHDLILPSVSAAEDPDQTKRKSHASVVFAYRLTTLQSFDKAVTKATCNTTVQIGSPADKSAEFRIDYTVTPSVEDPSNVVVTADMSEARAFAKLLTDAELARLADEKKSHQHAADEAANRAKLLAVVSEKWLTGVWIPSEADPATCATTNAVRFQRGHVLMGGLGRGQWALQQDKLHLLTIVAGETVDWNYTITDADAVSFEAWPEEDDRIALRRCTADEMALTPDPAQPAVLGTEQ